MISKEDRSRSSWMYPLLKLWVYPAIAYTILVTEIPLVLAIIQRSSGDITSITAFSLSLSILLVFNGFALPLAPTAISSLKKGKNLYDTFVYSSLVGVILSLCLAILVFTPLYELLFSNIIREDQIRETVRVGLQYFFIAPFAVAMRRYFQGIAIHSDSTLPVMKSAWIRLSLTIVFAIVLYNLGVEGVVIGSIALTIGALSEALAIYLQIRKKVNIFTGNDRYNLRGILNNHKPLMAKSLLQISVLPSVSLLLAYYNFPPDIIALWPIFFSTLALFEGPTQEIEGITLKSLGSYPKNKMFRFSIAIGSTLSILILFLLLSGLMKKYFSLLYEVNENEYTVLFSAIMLSLLMPLSSATRNFFRALAVNRGYNRFIEVAAIVNLGATLTALFIANRSGNNFNVLVAGYFLASLLELAILFTSSKRNSLEST